MEFFECDATRKHKLSNTVFCLLLYRYILDANCCLASMPDALCYHLMIGTPLFGIPGVNISSKESCVLLLMKRDIS